MFTFLQISDALLFAKKTHRQDDPIVAIVVLVAFVIFVVFAIVSATTTSYNVVIKGGTPYCPRCNRQVSYRRGVCRSCGYNFTVVSYSSSSPSKPREPFIDPFLKIAARYTIEIITILLLLLLAFARFAWLKIRLFFTFAWFANLPDWLQPIVVGLGISVPLGVVAILIFKR
jgi:hypothetical protein